MTGSGLGASGLGLGLGAATTGVSIFGARGASLSLRIWYPRNPNRASIPVTMTVMTGKPPDFFNLGSGALGTAVPAMGLRICGCVFLAGRRAWACATAATGGCS